MSKRDHLKRLEPSFYQGLADVHWTMTIRDRRTGWLDAKFLYRFRELVTHSQFRFQIACPIFCLMPDHIHLVWMGLSESTDQLVAMRHFRQRLRDSLVRIGFDIQDQAFDSVFKDDERTQAGLMSVCDYIAQNPERAGLVDTNGFAAYPFTGCIVPGYPELRPFADDFWRRFHRTVSHLRKNGVLHSGP